MPRYISIRTLNSTDNLLEKVVIREALKYKPDFTYDFIMVLQLNIYQCVIIEKG